MYRFCVTCGITLAREAKGSQPSATDRPAPPAEAPAPAQAPAPAHAATAPAAAAPAPVIPHPAPSQPAPSQPAPSQPAAPQVVPAPAPSQPSAAQPAAAVQAAPSVAASTAPIPGRLEERIIGSPVVEIAPGSAPQKPIVCPRCQGQCIPAARFSQFCGAALPAAGAASPAPAPRPSDPEPQRAPAVAREAPVVAAPARGPAPQQARGRLVVIEADGSEGMSFPLADRPLDVGRLEGDILVKEDPYVSPRHARLVPDGGRWLVRDLASTNGIYLRLKKPYLLQDADLLLLGQEVLQFQLVSEPEKGLGHANQHGTLLFGSPITSRSARLCQRTVEGIVRDVYYLHRDETVIGRETGDIVFTADPFLSRRHAMIRRSLARKDGRAHDDGAQGRDERGLRPRGRWDFTLTDLDSSNGTFVSIRNEIVLQHGDFIRVGQHLFRVDFA
jgi:pSer/pThr/pTyr-binding forkhead associated (FHA) protein